jgi:hypothetical protein
MLVVKPKNTPKYFFAATVKGTSMKLCNSRQKEGRIGPNQPAKIQPTSTLR